jgi:hypothetical protein
MRFAVPARKRKLLEGKLLEEGATLAASAPMWEAAGGLRPRLYCRGEQPITLLKAVLNALSDP